MSTSRALARITTYHDCSKELLPYWQRSGKITNLARVNIARVAVIGVPINPLNWRGILEAPMHSFLRRSANVAALLFVFLAIAFVSRDSIIIAGVDTVHHLVLVDELARHHTVLPADASRLEVMSIYSSIALGCGASCPGCGIRLGGHDLGRDRVDFSLLRDVVLACPA